MLYPEEDKYSLNDGEEGSSLFITERIEDYLALSVAAAILVIVLLFW
ncbi:hypothetical protein EDD75_0024 [Thermodesulfitimonas autotrophica]|uniref:Uncharacterized protein n=1 Tax=Thermodesulfitimonas autotrophica TaxID=1894989 RepID=A0A3N5B0R0_9THEO|nr:hypothetical protein [Thermodesulfitimonas autotrophica]RPF49220.1 hypothetical protein EDD75_0024 [Thermodesulfitimonas autotrophica]